MQVKSKADAALTRPFAPNPAIQFDQQVHKAHGEKLISDAKGKLANVKGTAPGHQPGHFPTAKPIAK